MAIEEELRLKGRNDTAAMFREVEGSFARLRDSAETFKSALGFAAGAAGAAGLVASFKGILDQAENFNKLAQKTGIATEALSELNYAAKLSDVSQEDLATGLKRLAVAMTDAAGGGKEAVDTFKAIGVEVRDASGNLRDTDSVLKDIAERFAGYADGPAKAALAVRIFGRSGDALIPLLNQMGELRREAQQFGTTFDTEFAQASERFNDNLKRLEEQSQRLKVSLLSGAIPALVQMSEEMIEGTRIAGNFGKALLTFATINPFQSIAQNIRDTTEAIRQNQAELEKSGLFGPNPLRRFVLERDTEVKQQQLEFLKYQQRQQALAGASALGDTRDARDRALTDRILRPAPVVAAAGTGATAAAKITDFDRMLKQLQDERDRTEELTVAQRLLASIEDGRLKLKTEGERAALLNLATEIDNIREAKALREGFAAAEKANAEAIIKEAEATKRLRQEFEDLADPSRPIQRRIEQLGNLQGTDQKLSAEDFFSAYGALQNQLGKVRGEVVEVGKEMDNSKEIARDFGLVMQSALSDSIRNWQGLGNLVKSIGIDIAQVITRITIMKPLEEGIAGIFKGSGGSSGGGIFSGIADFFGGLFKASGGPVYGGQPYIVGEQGPELFVPSQSGTIVPNGAMAANAPVYNITVNAPGVYDTVGFQRMLASNPALIAGLTEAGANRRGRSILG